MTVAARAEPDVSDGDAAETPPYLVVLARLLVQAALREISAGPVANDNLSTMVPREET